MNPDLFAGVAVADRARAVEFYDRLLGEVETFEPNDTEWVWTVAPNRHLYVEERPDDAGHSQVTLFVDDLAAFVSAARERGIEPDETETYGNGVRKNVYHDPDGNEVGIGGAPVADRTEDPTPSEAPTEVDVSALAINVAIPEELQWTATRQDRTFRLMTLNVRLLPDGRLASKAYGRPVEGGRAGYTSFPVPDRPELKALVTEAATRAGERWATAGPPVGSQR